MSQRGPTLPTIPQWRAAARARIAERGLQQRQIAAALGCSPGVISQVLGEPPRNESSDIVVPLSQYLDIPLPLVPLKAALISELYEHAQELQAADEDALRDLVASARNMRAMIERLRKAR